MIRYLNYSQESGIYAIVNTVNNKRYIGGASNFRRRAYEHFSALRRLKHYSKELQKDFITYGESVFEFNVLELCSENMIERENYFIQNLKSNTKECGYNSEGMMADCKGKKHTAETKEKVKIARSKQVMKPKHPIKCDQTNKIYDFHYQAAKEFGVHFKTIWAVLNKKKKSINGFTFSYLPKKP